VTRRAARRTSPPSSFWHSEDAFKAWAATPESAEVRNHAQGCGTTFTTYTGDVAEV
jgi:heme-degrading monooxygenase HmoA